MNQNDDQFISKIDQMRSSEALRNNGHFYTKDTDNADYTIEIKNSQYLPEEPFLSTKNNKDGIISQDNIFLLGEGKNYKICKIEILPKNKVQLHKHFHKNEFIYILSGAAIIFAESGASNLLANEFINIPKLSLHSIENQGVINLVLLEIQSGEYLGDDDILLAENNTLI
ncbi:MAG: hypothetical protein M0016_01965 [Deltaproteobacteria bacterium]|jgi:mannose-6-phosphate isomerase-like protein (cupin superfamily)|nr:hypothetical protein [Deltaproteobacteria bacterium]MCL5879805.1 hypothetical protein [Deltaproteobacteria bacterium]MDA8303912.1 hypothetical protein [Deltaproteobacteria bacterium]